jgi:hypothetical protein
MSSGTRWTESQLNEYYKRRHHAELARATNEAGAAGVPAANPERPARKALERPARREAEDGPCFEIVFTIYSRRPCDYDNYHCKILQDLLVRSGLLPDDDWRTLQGRCISKKANNWEEERTEVEIRKLRYTAYETQVH